jgi:glycosyltransferase 2 family protein
MKKLSIKFILKLILSLFLLSISLKLVNFSTLKLLFAELNFYYLVLSFFIIYAGILISSIKWKMLIGMLGIDLTVYKAFSAYCSGMFFNSFFPTTIGGDIVRAKLVHNTERPFDKNLVSIIFERYLGMIALAFFLFAGSITGLFTGYSLIVVLPGIAVSVAILATSVIFFLLRKHIAINNKFFNYRFTKPLIKYYEAFVVYRQFSKVTLKALIMSFAFQILSILYIFTVIKAFNENVPIVYLFIMVPLITIISALPLSVNGIGLREVSYIYFFESIGFSAAFGIAVSFLVFTSLLVINSMGGIVFLLYKKF